MSGRQPKTEWRQGRVLSVVAARSLSLVDAGDDDPVVMVVSHDCDIAASIDIEPNCEIICGRHVEDLDGNYTNAKSPRILHLTFSSGTVQVTAEFVALNKRKISKADLFAHSPADRVQLDPNELNTLRRWLAARYDRSAFADEFESRLKSGVYRSAYRDFVDIIKKTETHILAVLFDVDSGEEVKRSGPDDVYSLRISLIYSVSGDPAAAEIAVAQAADKIKVCFQKHYVSNGVWENIELESCEAISEAVFSVYEQRMMQEWQFEYMSLREDPQGETLHSAPKNRT